MRDWGRGWNWSSPFFFFVLLSLTLTAWMKPGGCAGAAAEMRALDKLGTAVLRSRQEPQSPLCNHQSTPIPPGSGLTRRCPPRHLCLPSTGLYVRTNVTGN
ncbi:hypothetical protein BDY21DRAFT_357613 [Lineolata rhizophorae]|uniref:Uncharacterized protein n=1 Tax=Lineolata rhizophorae TaxID=578093 RepID=A0A6A6NMU3_9PEZI|nr:hypothetical protein BDY21DRAFT_357613 [Lineolata rhizophorae]